ncbi:hypothetical protein [Sphingomonas rubra]|uniref:hypothetical protein n=1 Tax=Sphingomonas rubra TaxID=634430 RepID=UPI001160CE41|nr:hypothetical protein [Sphingomonas rubra]
MAIVSTTDWQRLVIECADELDQWHPQWRELDWQAMLDQPGWHLLTDGAGSWCLLEPVNGSTMGHIFIHGHSRGRAGSEIARAMLGWIASAGIASIVATPNAPKTRLFLRWLGFRTDDVDPSLMRLRIVAARV